MRCGTTSLHRYLATHPGIFMAKWPKEGAYEVNYFNNWWNRGCKIKKYRSLFPPVERGLCRGEKSPCYATRPEYMLRLRREVGDNVKIILILRNPIHRTYSGLAQSTNHSGKKGAPLDLYDEDACNATWTISNAFYDIHLQNVRNILPNSPLLVLYYEDYVKDNQAVLNRITEFLGVRRHDFEIRPYKKREKPPTHMYRELSDLFRPSVARLYAALGDQQILDWGII